MSRRSPRLIALVALVSLAGAGGTLHTLRTQDGISSAAKDARSATGVAKLEAFDLVWTNVERKGTHLVFTERVSASAGTVRPARTGALAGSSVFSYVWPVSLDPATAGFEGKSGTLALAATAHPDFDDTPKYDENGDGDAANDGDLWHSHWVVLVPDDACGTGALKVRDIPPGTTPRLPATWPGLPLFIDSPGYDPEITSDFVRVRVPLKELGFPEAFRFDGVTAALKVNASVHDPLLCVADVFDVASGNLSLPGTVR
ncbi:MAG: hypothetical protein IT357_17495 [Gemmatimonadaceae bacterium]|nr:hypothetical protein [Gemmatimonadaceae bacterium]